MGQRTHRIAAALGAGFIASVAAFAPAASASSRVAVAGSVPSWARSAAAVGAPSPAASVQLTIFLAPRDRAGLAAFVRAVSTPGNRLYHRYLTGARYRAPVR